jgi:hypothetical protein
MKKKKTTSKPTPSGRLFPEQAPEGYTYVQAHYRKRKPRKTTKRRRR